MTDLWQATCDLFQLETDETVNDVVIHLQKVNRKAVVIVKRDLPRTDERALTTYTVPLFGQRIDS